MTSSYEGQLVLRCRDGIRVTTPSPNAMPRTPPALHRTTHTSYGYCTWTSIVLTSTTSAALPACQRIHFEVVAGWHRWDGVCIFKVGRKVAQSTPRPVRSRSRTVVVVRRQGLCKGKERRAIAKLWRHCRGRLH